jgi:hypothetical protein
MIINDFDMVCVSFPPVEANSPLLIDANAELALSITLQCLKTIARRNFKIANDPCTIEQAKFAQCGVLDVWRQSATAETLPYQLRFSIGKTNNHARILTSIRI